jgi:putative pre-16S rRNA nuclease
MGRKLGIDHGLKRIGLALSDPTGTLASPLPTLIAERQTEKTLDKLLAVIAEHDIDEIVLGLPYRLSGQIGLQADEVKHFADALSKRTSIPVTLWDERLTSLQADRAMREGGLSRKKRAQRVDQLAAVLILQSYLDSRP